MTRLGSGPLVGQACTRRLPSRLIPPRVLYLVIIFRRFLLTWLRLAVQSALTTVIIITSQLRAHCRISHEKYTHVVILIYPYIRLRPTVLIFISSYRSPTSRTCPRPVIIKRTIWTQMRSHYYRIWSNIIALCRPSVTIKFNDTIIYEYSLYCSRWTLSKQSKSARPVYHSFAAHLSMCWRSFRIISLPCVLLHVQEWQCCKLIDLHGEELLATGYTRPWRIPIASCNNFFPELQISIN